MRKHLSLLIIIYFSFCSGLFSQITDRQFDYQEEYFLKAKTLFDFNLLKQSELSLLESLEKFDRASSDGNSALLSAKLDYISGNLKFADRKLENFINNNPNSPFRASAQLFRGYMAFESKRYEQCEKLFAEAKKIADKDFADRGDSVYTTYAQDALFWRAVSMSQRGAYQDAQPFFEECYRKYPGGKYADDALYSLGLIAELNRQYDNALTYFRTLSKSYPYSNCLIASKIREINNNLILRDYNSALLNLESTDNLWRKISSGDSTCLNYEKQSYTEHASEEILYLRGEAYNIQGNYNQAVIVFESFISTFSESELINYVRLGAGWAHLNLNNFDKAIQYYDKIIETEKDENSKIAAIARLYKAIALKKNGNIPAAQKEFLALSVQADYPFLAQSLLELGQIYYEDRDFESARKSLERADRESADANISIRIHLLLGATLMELTKWDKAVNEYKIAEQLSLKSSTVFIPQKNWYIAESRLKEGISLVRSLRNSEAIPPLLAFLSDNKNDPRGDQALFWLAEAYYRSDLLNNSADKYQSLINLYPESPLREEAFYGLGWSYFRQKDFKNSSETFDKMLKEFPDSRYAIEVLTRQGDGYYVTRNYREAAGCYKRAAEKAPNTEEGQYSAYQLCHAYYKLGQFEDAITYLLAFVRKYSKSSYAPHALYLTGWIRFQQKRYGEAVDDFQFLTQAYTGSQLVPRAYYAIGDCYYNQGNFENAIEAYKHVVDSYPGNALAPEALKSMQDCYLSLGKDDEAIKIADRFVESNPSSPFAPDFVFKKGEMFYTGKNYKDAVAEYENFIRKYPESDKNAEAMFLMGKSYENLNDPDKAELTYNQLIKKYPKSDYASQALLQTALIRKQKSDISGAEKLFEQVQQEFPGSASAAQSGFETAVIKFSLGDTVGALKQFGDVANKYKGMEYADQSRYRIAMYYKLAGSMDSAKAQFELLANRLDNPAIAAEAQYRIGEILMRNNNYDEASKAFLTVRERFSGYEDWFSLSLLNLGECYEKLNKKDAAVEVYQSLSTLRPDDDYGKTAKRRLKSLENQ